MRDTCVDVGHVTRLSLPSGAFPGYMSRDHAAPRQLCDGAAAGRRACVLRANEMFILARKVNFISLR